MQRLLDYIYVILFGKYTIQGFVSQETEGKKYNYTFDSVFPDEETIRIAFSSDTNA